MSVRIDQEGLELVVEKLSSSNGNTRLNQELVIVDFRELNFNRTNTRLNQEAMLLVVNVNFSGGRVQVTGGQFMDAEGNPVANGTCIMLLSNDAKMTSSGKVVHAIPLYLPLDSNGNISGTQSVFPTDTMTPTGTTYTVWVQNSNGAQVWGPHVETVTSVNSSFSITSGWITST